MRTSNFLNLNECDLDRYVYRVISVERLINFYNIKKNVLCKPGSWDDPFENSILKSRVRESSGEIIEYDYHKYFYGQCWTLHKASDAMWRIYSKKKKGVRMRTTIRKLANSLSQSGVSLPDVTCYLGKVRYLSAKNMTNFANSIYYDGSVPVTNLFNSLLVKRLAFKHEKEVRILYSDVTKNDVPNEYSYDVNPNELIDQLMLDPRLTFEEYKLIKKQIKDQTDVTCKIKRSLLYSAPEEVILNVQKSKNV